MITREQLKPLIDLQAEYLKAKAQAEKCLEVYQEKCKEIIGVKDGEQMNVVQLVNIMIKVVEND